jgi:DNA replication initiation complex subunit (GINS family)
MKSGQFFNRVSDLFIFGSLLTMVRSLTFEEAAGNIFAQSYTKICKNASLDSNTTKIQPISKEEKA